MKIKLILVSFLLGNSTFAKFSNETELATIINGGNTVQETWYAKTLNTYVQGKNTYKLGGHYSYGKADESLNARNWDVNTRYERTLSTKWSGFAAIQDESDVFAKIEYRWNYDLGGIFHFIMTEKVKFFTEVGYRRSLESNLLGDKSNSSKLRVYGEYYRHQNESFFYKLWVEALPSISESDEWLLNVEPSLNVTVSSVFTLKVAYLYKYNNQPAVDTKKNDYQYTTSLVANF